MMSPRKILLLINIVVLPLGFLWLVSDIKEKHIDTIGGPIKIDKSVLLDGRRVAFDWTDDNLNEDLIIRTNKQTYTQGLSHAEVYLSLTNNGVAQNVEVMGHFKNQKIKLAKIQQFVEVTRDVVRQEHKKECKDVKTATTTVNVCTGTSVMTTSTVTENVWQDIPTKGRSNLEKNKENLRVSKRKSVEQFVAPSKTEGVFIEQGETIYMKALIEFSPNSSGNFYFEAIGYNGSYGHLDPWFDASWTYKHVIEINDAKVDATLSSYPVYLDLADLPTAFHTNVKTDGCDIRIVESNDSTETAFDLVDYDSAGDTGELHFLADSLSSSATTTFYIYYGNSGASCYAADATYGSEAVWANYEIVQHMNEGSGNVLDSTANDRTGTAAGNPTYAQTGQMGDAIVLDGTGDWFLTAASDYDLGTGYTLQSWIKANSIAATQQILGRDEGGGDPRHFQFRLDSTGEVRFIPFNTSAGTIANFTSTAQVDDNALRKIDATYDNTNGSDIYIDGSNDGSDATTATHKDVSAILNIGSKDIVPNNPWIGTLDELRISSAPLASTWLSTEFNNQSSASTFYFIGAVEEDAGGGGSTPLFEDIVWFN